MDYYSMYYGDYLAHHGKDGQAWGIRNGPPYPLSRGEGRSDSIGARVKQRKEKNREKLRQKVMRSTDSEYVKRHLDILTTEEMRAVKERLDATNTLRSTVNSPMARYKKEAKEKTKGVIGKSLGDSSIKVLTALFTAGGTAMAAKLLSHWGILGIEDIGTAGQALGANWLKKEKVDYKDAKAKLEYENLLKESTYWNEHKDQYEALMRKKIENSGKEDPKKKDPDKEDPDKEDPDKEDKEKK